MAKQDTFITSLQKDSQTSPPPSAVSAKAHIGSFNKYQEMYDRSVQDSHAFWLEQATRELKWFKTPAKTLEYMWDSKKRVIQHTWFADGELNVAENCLDRHLSGPTKDKTAILWQGEKDEEVRKITYQELHQTVCRFANVLLSNGLN